MITLFKRNVKFLSALGKVKKVVRLNAAKGGIRIKKKKKHAFLIDPCLSFFHEVAMAMAILF